MPHHESRLLCDKSAAAGDDVRLISFPKAGHGTDFAMLSDDAPREGAYEKSAHAGHTTAARPVTPTWQTVVSFLEQRLPSTENRPSGSTP